MGTGTARGQSVVIGAVIIFGFIIVSMSLYQGTVIPDQNEEIEFKHEQKVRSDLVDARDSIATAGISGKTSIVSIKLGTRFPNRPLFINPPPAAGRIKTGEPMRITLNTSEATFPNAVSGEEHETAEGWPTPAAAQINEGIANYTTKPLVYTPQYQAYDSGPDNITLVLSRVNARYSDGRHINLAENPLLVSGNHVTLFLLYGNLSQSGIEPVTLKPTAISPVSERQTISDFTITLPTPLTPSEFNSSITEGTTVDPDSIQVSQNASRPGAVDVRFTDEYKLAVAAVSVGQHQASRRPATISIVSVKQGVTQGNPAQVVVEARDQYGNALSGASVVANGSNVSGSIQQTNSDGQATFEFNTSDVSGTTGVDITVNQSVASLTGSGQFDQSTAENATVNVSVSTSSIDPGAVISVRWNTSAMDATKGINYHKNNDTLFVNRTELAGDEFNARANVTEDGKPLSSAQLDFTTRDPDVVDFDISGSNEPGPTNEDGQLVTPARVSTNGTTTISLIGLGTGDQLTVKTTSDPDPGPPGSVAFNDTNGNGKWDSADKASCSNTIKKDWLENSSSINGHNCLNDDINLVIPPDVGSVISSSISIQVDSINSSVDFRSVSGGVTLKADQGAPHRLDVTGITIRTPDGQKAQLVAENIHANGTVITGGQIEIKAEKQSGGTNNLVNSQLLSENSGISINGEEVRATGIVARQTSGSSISIKSNKGKNNFTEIQNALIETVGGGSVTVNGDGIKARNAVIKSSGQLKLIAKKHNNGKQNGTLLANGTQLESEGDDIQLTAKELIEVADSGTQEARIIVYGASAKAKVKSIDPSPDVINVDGVSIIDKDDVLALNNDDTKVEGEPESGETK